MLYFYDKIFFMAFFTLGLLTAIYFLYRRSRLQRVSTLMFWEDQLKSRRSGLKLKRLPLPLTFLLELLAIIMLVLAAARPVLPRWTAGEVVVVLDNSYSMQAGGVSALDKARKRLNGLLRDYSGRKFRLILSGATARNLGVFTDAGKAKAALENWRGEAPQAELKSAVALGRKLGGERAEIIVLTDHLPEFKEVPDDFKWLAFGRKLNNIAIVNAVRASDRSQRCLVIIGNFSDISRQCEVRLSLPDGDWTFEKKLELGPDSLRKVVFKLPDNAKTVELELSSDELQLDNRVVLLPERNFTLRTAIELQDRRSAELIRKALRVTGKVSFAVPAPQLVITDNADRQNCFCKLVLQSGKGRILTGPYTLDRRHPLTEGLFLKGVLWGEGAAKTRLPGTALIMCGRKVLFSLYGEGQNNVELFLNLNIANSTLQDTPNWPVLFMNLVDWNIGRLPGIKRRNYRLGEKISFKSGGGERKVLVRKPDGGVFELKSPTGEFSCPLDRLGRYEIESKQKKNAVFVNALNSGESDLRSLGGGELEGRTTPATLQENYLNIGWIFILVALGLLCWDWYLVRRNGK